MDCVGELDRTTIQDFGRQWQRYQAIDGYFGSVDLLADMVGPLVSTEALQGKRVADIGSGSGRIVSMLLQAGVSHVAAVEPSEAFQVLLENTRPNADRITYLHATGEQLPASGDLDYVFSIGVLHHIVDPQPVVRAAYAALHPGGKFVAWLYGKEGNELYLALVRPLRAVTTRMPAWMLAAMAWGLTIPAVAYIQACRVLPLPMRGFMRKVLGRLSWSKIQLDIFDQCSPAYAKYYTRQEARALLERSGFVDVCEHHRHGYSWTVVGTKADPGNPGAPGIGCP